MSRPSKCGLDYFPMDVSFWDDLKIMNLLEKYGAVGTAVYQIVVSRIYKDGYYLETSQEMLAAYVMRIIGGQWVESRKKVCEILDFCGQTGLFDYDLMNQGVYTSAGIQKRYNEITKRNKVDKSKYRLIPSAEENKQNDTYEQGVEEKNNSDKKEVSATETEVFAAETPVFAEKKPQKKSKVNKSKENKNKLNEIKVKESPAVFSVECTDGVLEITDDLISEYNDKYKNINVVTILKKIIWYLGNNPNKRNTAASTKNYIEMWLNKDNSEPKKPVSSDKATYDLSSYESVNVIVDENW